MGMHDFALKPSSWGTASCLAKPRWHVPKNGSKSGNTLDPETGLLHIYQHGVTEAEAEWVLTG
jgi:hypothetical protein